MSLFSLLSPRHEAINAVSTKHLPKLCEANQVISECFGDLEQNTEYPYVSGANWSTHDLLLWILGYTGPASLSMATWSISNNAADLILQLRDEGILTNITAVLDWRVRVRTPNLLPLLKYNNADLRVTSCHAKVFVLQNDEWTVSLVGSANLTNNPRIEAGHLSTTPAIGEFHREWLTKEVQNAKPFGEEVGRRKPGKQNAL